MTVDCLTHYYPSQRGVDLPAYLQAAKGQLVLDGTVSVRDRLLPGSLLRGKKARLQQQAGHYVQAFLQLGQPTHGRGYCLDEWHALFRRAGLQLVHQRTTAVAYDLDEWAATCTAVERIRLRALVCQAPTAVLDYLTPLFAGDRITFHLQELLIIGRVESDSASSHP